jgi:hypothetical protein
MVCSRWWNLAMRWTTVDRVLNENFPPIACLLKRVKVECNKIVEEVALDLTSENVKLATQDVQGMSITSWRARTCRKCTRPLLGCCLLSVLEGWFMGSENFSQVLSRYRVSSSTSPSSILVSPPKTMKALPTSRLAWPTLGPGPSEVVATG